MQKKTTARKTNTQTAAKPASMETVNAGIGKEDFVSKVRQRAQEIWLARGNSHGDQLSDWLQAEHEMKAKYRIAN